MSHDMAESVAAVSESLDEASAALDYDIADLDASAHSPAQDTALGRIMAANRRAMAFVQRARAQLIAMARDGRLSPMTTVDYVAKWIGQEVLVYLPAPVRAKLLSVDRLGVVVDSGKSHSFYAWSAALRIELAHKDGEPRSIR